jgi:hypothetical protein
VLPASLSVSNILHALTKLDVLREGDPSLAAVEACADWLRTKGGPRHNANTAWAFARLYCTRQKRARFAPLAPFVLLGLGWQDGGGDICGAVGEAVRPGRCDLLDAPGGEILGEQRRMEQKQTLVA